MTFKDIVKQILVNGVQTSEMSLVNCIIALFFAVLAGVYLFVVYKMFVRKTLYNINLNISLVGLVVVITAVMLTIQSNLVLSLGMVGALSIVRYRTAVKDPMDLFFLFWAIADGIMCGARQYILAFIVTVILTLLIFVLAQLPSFQAPYVLVVNGRRAGLEEELFPTVEKYCKHYKTKSRNISRDTERVIIELKVSEEKELLEELLKIKAIEKVALLTYEGDVVG